MSHEPDLPIVPDDDPAVDRALSGVGRFSPQRGFEDRVVGKVRVPLPAWLRGMRDRWRALTSGVSGWGLLATFSLATAAAWGTAAVVGLQAWDAVSGLSGIGLSEIGSVARRVIAEGVVPGWQVASAEIAAWLRSLRIDPRAFVVGYGVVILVCAVALRVLTAEPAKGRGTSHAAS